MQTSYQISLGKGYIMAVEDSMVQAKKLKNFFDNNNINNVFFTNAIDAYAAALENVPLLVISDIVMPGMDGYEFCSKLKTHPTLREIPVILLTSLSDPLDIIKGLQAGADNFITKPYEEQYLLSRSVSIFLRSVISVWVPNIFNGTPSADLVMILPRSKTHTQCPCLCFIRHSQM